MALTDYRAIVEVAGGAYIAVEVTDPTAHRPIRVTTSGPVLELGEHEAGELFDVIAGAIRAVVQGAVTVKLHAADTPRDGGNGGVS